MKIINSTELMKNQKHAVTMAPGKEFEVLQTAGGHSLFFSIGTDNIFYCTREIPADTHGWDKQDLSTALSANHNNAAITARTFDVFQNPEDGTIEIALVITAGGSDFLYAALSISNDDTAWDSTTITFNQVPFDDPAYQLAGHEIADIFISKLSVKPEIIADVIKDPSSPIKTIFRYFVDPTKTVSRSGLAWNQHDLSTNLEAGNIVSKQGRRKGQTVDGVYTMGTFINTQELIYTPVYDAAIPKNQPLTAPNPIRLTLPDGATQMALSVNDQRYTDLFLAAGSSLWFMAAATQKDGAVATSIYTHPLLNEVQSLHVNNDGSNTIVWGLNQQGQVFYLTCATGSEADSTAWSYPVPILEAVEGVASYIDGMLGSNVIFAHMQNDTLIQLTQDATTTIWQQRSILLPTTDTNDYVETHTFTTHIQCTDDNNVPLNFPTVSITATHSCSVYINDIYYKLSSDDALDIMADSTGVINIMQTVDTIAGVCYSITGDGLEGAPVTINPMINLLAKLDGVKSGTDLDQTVTDEYGVSKNLVGDNITADQKDQIAQYIAQFVALKGDVPADGSQQDDDPQVNASAKAVQLTAVNANGALVNIPAAVPAAGKVFGVHFGNNNIQFFNSAGEAHSMGAVLPVLANVAPQATALATSNPVDSIEIAAGDGWRWLKNEFDKIETFFIAKIGEINHIFVCIAGAYYNFAMRAIHDIAAGIHFVLNKIAVAFEDLVKWLGSIFAWVDILRTHKVIKNLFNQYGNHVVSNIDTVRSQLKDLIGQAEGFINNWAGLPPTGSYQDQQNGPHNDVGQHGASANWGSHHTKGNIGNSGVDNSTTVDNDPNADGILAAIEGEAAIMDDVFNKMKDLFASLGSMPMDQFFKQLVAILADGFLDSAGNVLDAFLAVAGDMMEGAMDVLNAPINIPVISPVYKMFAKEDLSIMDLVCLVSAIPVTVIYKLANGGTAPFPDDDDTSSLINAKSYEEIAQLCIVPASAKPSVAMPSLRLSASEDGGTVTARPAAALSNLSPATYNKIWDKLNFTGNILAGFGGLGIAVMGTMKAFTPAKWQDKLPIINKVYAACYFPYVGPDIIGGLKGLVNPSTVWYNLLNEVFGIVGAAKACVDCSKGNKSISESKQFLVDNPPPPPPANIPAGYIKAPDKTELSSWDKGSAWFDLVLNIAWEIPTVASYLDSDKNTNDILGLTGNTCFNATGVMSPAILYAADSPALKGWLVGTAAVLNLGYGAMSMAISLDGLPAA